MERKVNKNYMYNLELKSMHFWFKNSPSKSSPNKYNNILKIMQNTIYNNDISDVVTDNNKIQSYTKIINFRDRCILRNVFEHWKIYVVHKLYTRRSTYKADYFYNKKLQKMVLNILSKNVLLKWQHIVSFTDKSPNEIESIKNYSKAEKHCIKTLLRLYFKYWLNYVSFKSKKKILLGKAVTFYNSYCLKTCINNWKMYIMQQREKKALHDKAYNFYTKGILQKYLKAWISICEFTLLKDKVDRAVTYYNNKLLLKYFYTWEIYCKVKLRKLNIEKYIQTYYRKKLLKRYFKRLTTYVNESIADKMAYENIETIYNFKLIQKAFTAWQSWHNKRIENAIKARQIKDIFETRTKHIVLRNWSLYVFEKKCKRRKTFMSRNFYEKNLAIKVIRRCHTYAIYKKEKRIQLCYLNDSRGKIIKQLQYIYIERWRKSLYGVIQEKQKLNQAIKFWEFHLTRKYFFYWKEFSRQYKTKMFHKEKLHAIAVRFLLKRFILQWRDKLKIVLEIREKETLVVSMIEHKIIRKCLSSWVEYTARKVKMKHDIEMAKEFHKKLLLREGLKEILRNSLHDINERYDMQLENAVTRSFKNFEILKEYFDKWYFLIYLKNRSKFVGKVTRDDNPRLIQYQTSSNDVFDNLKNTSLILPDYMKEQFTITCTE